MKKVVFLFFIVVFLTSCGTFRLNRTKDFAKLNHPISELNGEYYGYSFPIGKQKTPTNAGYNFNLGQSIDFFTLTFLDSDKVKIEYNSIIGPREVILTGKMKKKFFEVYFNKKQFIIPVLISSIQIDRIRIGKDKEGNLLIMSFYENAGNILIFGDSKGGESPNIYKKSEVFDGLRPFEELGKWGYKDADGHTVIEPKFDFARIFHGPTAIVYKNKKYGLTDLEGNEVTDFIYDELRQTSSYNETPYYSSKSDKGEGIITIDGKEILKPVYKYISFGWKGDFSFQSADGYGKATFDGIIIPPRYDRPFYFNEETGYATVEKDGYYYIVDREGYEYDTKYEIRRSFWSLYFPVEFIVPKPETKRKIEWEED